MITRIILTITTLLLIASCDQNMSQIPDTDFGGNHLILNNGNWGSNDACITIHDIENCISTSEAFSKANGMNLGDLGQDIISTGEEIYIAVYGSQIIFVTDKDLKIKRTIITEAEGNRLSPRCLTIGENLIYVTYYEGYLGEIDPAKDCSVKTVKVGANPDGLAYADGKIYVANSGGMNYPDYDNTVSVVDASSFTVSSVIEVNSNPSKVIATPSEGKIFVTSYGNYSDLPAKLQSIDIRSELVTDIPLDNVSSAAAGPDGTLYILCGGYDDQWNPLPGSVYTYCQSTITRFTGTTFPDAYSISATEDGYIFIGCSDYTTTGDIYILDPSGKLISKSDSHGLNPIKVICR